MLSKEEARYIIEANNAALLAGYELQDVVPYQSVNTAALDITQPTANTKQVFFGTAIVYADTFLSHGIRASLGPGVPIRLRGVSVVDAGTSVPAASVFPDIIADLFTVDTSATYLLVGYLFTYSNV